MGNEPGEVTRILDAIRSGQSGARDALFSVLYQELKRIAKWKMAGESPGDTLQPTALVNEAYLRLVGEEDWQNRAHFFGVAAEAMRQILIERARKRKSLKYGGDRQRVPLCDADLESPGQADDLVAVDEALTLLESRDARKATVVKYRYILGLSVKDSAQLLGVSPRTVDDDWKFAKAWLRREIRKGNTGLGK